MATMNEMQKELLEQALSALRTIKFRLRAVDKDLRTQAETVALAKAEEAFTLISKARRTK